MATTARMKTLNGVDVDQLMATIHAIEDNPELAYFEFRAHSEWVDEARPQTEIQHVCGAGKKDTLRDELPVLRGDEPPVLLGSNAASNAVETMLHGLAACLGVGIVYNAAARGIEIERLEFDFDGDPYLRAFLSLSEEVRRGFGEVPVNYRIRTDAPREDVEEMCEQVKKTSPVLDIIANGVPVEISLEQRGRKRSELPERFPCHTCSRDTGSHGPVSLLAWRGRGSGLLRVYETAG